MYESFYGLREKPFSILPDPDLIYWGHGHRLAFAMLEFGVLNNAGFTVITGEIGSGKTTLIRYLMRRLGSDVTVGLVSSMPPGGSELLRWIMMALEQPFQDSYPLLHRRFENFLCETYNRRRHTILIIDEAQNLGLAALEELRMLSNINVDKHQLLQLILVGQPQLQDLLRSPQLVQFAQRVSSDFHLTPLSAPEVANYIDYRLRAAGAKTQLFTQPACDLIARASGGIPRAINILCDTSLVYGFAANTDTVTADLVCEVINHKRSYGVVALGQVDPSRSFVA